MITAQRVGVALGGATHASATISNSGNIAGSVGIAINPADTGSNTIANFGTITGTDGTAINLGTVGSDLVVMGAVSSLQGVVSNLHVGDAFDLLFTPFSSGGTTTVVSNGTISQTLQIVENSTTFSIALDPNQSFAGDTFCLLPTMTVARWSRSRLPAFAAAR